MCAQVYKAQWHKSPVAVKVLKELGKVEAFNRESAILKGLRNPHIVTYYEHLIGSDGTVSLGCNPVSQSHKVSPWKLSGIADPS